MLVPAPFTKLMNKSNTCFQHTSRSLFQGRMFSVGRFTHVERATKHCFFAGLVVLILSGVGVAKKIRDCQALEVQRAKEGEQKAFDAEREEEEEFRHFDPLEYCGRSMFNE